MKAAALLAVLLAACSPAAEPTPPPAAAAKAAEAAPAPARLMAPEQYVAGFYKQEPKWDTPEAVRALFEPVLAEALIKDMSIPGEVGNVNFSFWCGCQDGEISDVKTTSRALTGGYEVTARFTLFEKPKTIVYRLLTTEAGYRIADVWEPAENGEEGWSLRRLLKLGRHALDLEPRAPSPLGQ